MNQSKRLNPSDDQRCEFIYKLTNRLESNNLLFDHDLGMSQSRQYELIEKTINKLLIEMNNDTILYGSRA